MHVCLCVYVVVKTRRQRLALGVSSFKQVCAKTYVYVSTYVCMYACMLRLVCTGCAKPAQVMVTCQIYACSMHVTSLVHGLRLPRRPLHSPSRVQPPHKICFDMQVFRILGWLLKRPRIKAAAFHHSAHACAACRNATCRCQPCSSSCDAQV
jgi:hypothetical protein